MGGFVLLLELVLLRLFSSDFFNVSVNFLDDGLLKLSCIGCIHGLMELDIVHVVACGERYRIQHVFLNPQFVLVHGVMVVFALFF